MALFSSRPFAAAASATASEMEQLSTEEACAELYAAEVDMDSLLVRDRFMLQHKAHIAYLSAGLGTLSSGYKSLDASRPWLCYWILHGLEVLSSDVTEDPAGTDATTADAAAERQAHSSAVVAFLASCQDLEGGGFCGGPRPGQLAHLAPTYAAVNALCTIGTEEAYAAIDRKALRRFLLRMKAEDGSFRMHEDGESDVRGSYCALSVATLCGLMDDEIAAGAIDWICACQTYEGGIGATPGEEAHGGYTFCGLAAAILVGGVSKLRLGPLLHWLAQRQMTVEGGFQGRTNKLVDSCYSFWQGACFPLMQAVLSNSGAQPDAAPVLNCTALLDYLLVCAQVRHGGFRDKPGKGRDFYHTCYSLSGLAVAAAGAASQPPPCVPSSWVASLRVVNPIHNISARKAERALSHFSAQPKVTSES